MMAREVDYRFKKKRARERKRLENDPALAVCWLCGGDIDMDLPRDHDMAFSLDHIVPVGRGGDIMGETRPAHRICNSSRGIGREKKQPDTLLDW